MTVFADSSAIVKLYADEEDHAVVRALPLLVISALARVEVPAAMWRKHRMGEITADAVAVLVAEFEADCAGTEPEEPRLLEVAVTDDIVDAAARLVGVHGLRAYDAMQLATALAVREVDPDCGQFAAFDKSLRSAAAAEGFLLLPAR